MSQEFFELLESDDGVPAPVTPESNWGPRHRSTSCEVAERVEAARELLVQRLGTAYAAQELAERYGVTDRQARNYVSRAAKELYCSLDMAGLRSAAEEEIHLLKLMCAQAVKEGDTTAERKSRVAVAAAADRHMRAVFATSPDPVRRITLRRSHTRPEIIG